MRGPKEVNDVLSPTAHGAHPLAGASASRSILMVLLLILVAGQAFWIYRRVNGQPPLAFTNAGQTTAPTGGVPETPSVPPVAVAPATLPPPLPPKAVPKNPNLGANDILLALSGIDGRVKLNMLPERRLAIGEALSRMADAENQRWRAVEQMRAAFSVEQALKIPELIQQARFNLAGTPLLMEAQRVLSKTAGHNQPPTAPGTPVPEAAKLDWDQSLRGALALEDADVSLTLTGSQAAQLLAAIPEFEDAVKKSQQYQTHLNSLLTPPERRQVYRYLPPLRARLPELEARSTGQTTRLRLLNAAMAGVQQ